MSAEQSEGFIALWVAAAMRTPNPSVHQALSNATSSLCSPSSTRSRPPNPVSRSCVRGLGALTHRAYLANTPLSPCPKSPKSPLEKVLRICAPGW